MSQYRLHDNINSNNTSSFNNVWINYTVADDRSQILTWLSPLEPRLRHKDIQENRVRSVGEWVLQTEEFKGWQAGSRGGMSGNAVLFCYGDPGVGKTFISSLVIDKLCDQARGQNATVACFYFDFAARKEHSPTNILGALLKQLVWGLDAIPKEISLAYEDQKNAIGGRGPQLADIVKMLYAAASEKPTFICIDALDECVAGYRAKLLDSLNEILQRSPGTRVFVTGRPHVGAEVGKRLPGRAAIRVTPRRDDIISYIHSKLDEDATPDAMDNNLKADILKRIPEDISELFLLVSLNIDAILQETTISRRRQKLNAMTDGLGLGGAYGGTLSRIKGQGGEKARLGMAALMWITHAEQPLKVDELCHALGVEIGSADLDGDNIPSIGTLLTCCQGLVSVDKEASTVRLIHFTLHEYLRAHPQLFDRPHATMAETCLSYLNSRKVKAISTSPSPDLRGTPFVEYSSLYWGVHAKRDLSADAKQLALKLFDDYSGHISIKLLLGVGKSPHFFRGCDNYPGFSSLHCASLFGIFELVADFLELEGCDINKSDCLGCTPLAWAAWNGHDAVAELLLGRDDVDPNKRCVGDRTPLLCAAWKGHEGVVKLLLGRDDICPNEPEAFGRTPLWCAAEYGWTGIVKVLLGRDDVSPNKLDNEGRTALSAAAQYGHEAVVKILLARDDVNVDTSDKYSRTPLWGAAQTGQGRIVNILLGRHNIRPDEPDIYGQTPLWCAALGGHEEVVKILHGRDDVNADKLDNDGRTPLSVAAQYGHEGIVNMLLGRDYVSADKPDRPGRTPLWGAAQTGQGGIVKILLGRRDMNPDEPDIYGRTPLWGAAEKGHEGVVKILLGRGGVGPDRPDICCRTPLWCAAENGHGGVVKILLRRDGVDPDRPDNNGRTPLWCAAFYGRKGVVRILLSRGGTDPNKPDNNGQTPLLCASENGHEGVVEMLLEQDNIGPDKPDIYGRSPLWCAAFYGHEEVVKVLLRRSEVKPDQPDICGTTPLCGAAHNGHEEVVKLLLELGDVNADKPDKNGRTPLWGAAEKGHEGVVKILLGQGDVSPEKSDNAGQSPLHCAALRGHERVVRMLLGRDDVSPNRRDRGGHTPRFLAASSGHAGVVALLSPRASAAPGAA